MMLSGSRSHPRHVLILLLVLGCDASGQVPDAIRFERLTVPLGGGGGAPYDLVAADIDGDGNRDLVVARRSADGTVQALLGDGHGGFRLGPTSPAGSNPVDLAAADFDEDGTLDLVVANHATDQVSVLLGDGRAGFHPAAGSPVRPGFSPHPHAVLTGDINEDGHQDFLVDDRGAHGLLLMLGRGDGTFAPARPVPVGGDPYRETWLGDLNADGHLDLVTPNERNLAVLLGDGSGTFRPAPHSPVAARDPFGVTVTDLDGDGVPDLAAAPGEHMEGIPVLLGTPNAGWLSAPGSPLSRLTGPGRMVSGDLDGDGRGDIVAVGYPGSYVVIISYRAGKFSVSRMEVGAAPWGVVLADLDGDGAIDVATANAESGDVTVLLNRGRQE